MVFGVQASTRSALFRTLWAAHDVRVHRTGSKNVHHSVVGDRDLTFEAMGLTLEPGLQSVEDPPGAAGPAPRSAGAVLVSP